MIYILKFNSPIGGSKHRAQYYIGWCKDGAVNRRVAQHKRGKVAKITRAVVAAGIDIECVALIPGDKRVERWLKNKKNTRIVVERWKRGKLRLPFEWESTPLSNRGVTFPPDSENERFTVE